MAQDNNPFPKIILFGIFLGALFLVFAFRGLIAGVFVPEISIEDSPPAVEQQGDQSTDGNNGPGSYIVKENDTLYSIGSQLGISWTQIAEVNNLEPPYDLETGQELTIPNQ